jgi:hypothetical protein
VTEEPMRMPKPLVVVTTAVTTLAVTVGCFAQIW